jgi:hypothetical protein
MAETKTPPKSCVESPESRIRAAEKRIDDAGAGPDEIRKVIELADGTPYADDVAQTAKALDAAIKQFDDAVSKFEAGETPAGQEPAVARAEESAFEFDELSDRLVELKNAAEGHNLETRQIFEGSIDEDQASDPEGNEG